MAGKQLHSPKGAAIYPWLNRADDKFGDPVYKVTLRIPKEDAEPMLNKLQDMLDEFIEAEKEKTGKKRFKDGEPSWEVDEEDEDFVLIKFKQNKFGKNNKTNEEWENKVRFYDAKGNPITGDVPAIYNGSTLKAGFRPEPWQFSGKVGIKLRLIAVQIIDLAERSASSADDGFGEEEGGYSYDPDTFGDESDDDEDAGDW